MMDGKQRKYLYVALGLIVLFACIALLSYYFIFLKGALQEEKIQYIETVPLSGQLKEYESKDVGIQIDIPQEYMIDDTKYTKDFPYIGFIAPGYEAKIDVVHLPKAVFFRNGGYKTLEEYFSFKRDFWRGTGFWIEGEPITIEGEKAYYMVTKFGNTQKESIVLLEKDDEVYQIKLYEFREDPKNSEILKKTIRSIKLTN